MIRRRAASAGIETKIGNHTFRASDYTAPALHTSREFLQHKIIVLATLQELVYLLEQQGDLADFFDKKSQAAQIHKDPYFKPLAM
jgi:hypothetical protein